MISSIKTDSHYFKNLDALRFFAFLSVFISHTVRIPNTGNSSAEIFLNIVLMNYLGVPFFFSLSSFLITYRLLLEKEKNGNIQLLKFYKNRILRIWPAYYTLIIICFIILPIAAYLLQSKGPTLPPLLPFIFFYVNFYTIDSGGFFTFSLLILWSISIEEQFYIVWGILLKFTSKKMIGIVILFLMIISIAFSNYYLHKHPRSSNYLAIHSLFVLQNFCTGAWAAYFSQQKSGRLFSKSFKKVLFASAYFILPVCYLFVKDFIFINILKSICYGLIIYDQSCNSAPLFNAGKFSVINYLGKISYGLYLYHAVIKELLKTQLNFFSYTIHPSLLQNITQSIIALAITVFVAHLSYKYIESKFLAMKSN